MAVTAITGSRTSLDEALQLGSQRCTAIRHDPRQQWVEVHKNVLQHTNSLQTAVGWQQQESLTPWLRGTAMLTDLEIRQPIEDTSAAQYKRCFEGA